MDELKVDVEKQTNLTQFKKSEFIYLYLLVYIVCKSHEEYMNVSFSSF